MNIMRMQQIILLLLIATSVLSGQSDTQLLISTLLSDTPIEEDLQELCDNIGGRVTGSQSNEKAVQWAYEKFVQAGVKVSKQAFTMPALWLGKTTTMVVGAENSFQPLVVSKYQSPPGTYSGTMVNVGIGDEQDFERAINIKGNIVIVESDLCLDIGGLFAEYAHAAKVEQLARQYGAKAIVFMSSRGKKLLYRFITMKGAVNELPQLIMAREDASRIIRRIGNGEELTATIEIDAEIGGQFESHNVIAEIKGSTYPEEVIVIGAHIDSWALGTGANDNGCNVSMMIDIARQMKQLNIKPKRTIRFALWNGEEQGYFGSWAYTKAHVAELDNHKMALSIDIGSGALSGFFTNGRAELVPLVDQALKPVAALGEFTNVNVPIVGTDNFDFMLEGVPNLVGNHLSATYGLNYHAQSDTYDKVDLKSLKRNSAIVASLTLAFANAESEDWNIGRQTRSEIQQIFDDSDLEFTMRMFGVHEPWTSGSRGRKK